MSRNGFKISRVSEEESTGDRVDWLDSFARKVDEISQNPVVKAVSAVEKARTRDAQSIVDQISAIVGNKKVHTVATLVDEYQDRIGLKDYLKRMSEKEDGQKKTAQEATPGSPVPAESLPAQPNNPSESQLPIFNKLSPADQQDLKAFIRNKCESHYGNIQVPALVEEVSRTFRQKGVQPQDVNDTNFEKFINDEIIRAKKMFPSQQSHNPQIGSENSIDTNGDGKVDVYDALTSTK